MNILFVMEPRGNAGCTHAAGQLHAGRGASRPHHRALRHAAAEHSGMRLPPKSDFDRIIYVFESELYRINRLQEVALLATIPRQHRYIFDSDGRYNPLIVVDGYDRNFHDGGRANGVAGVLRCHRRPGDQADARAVRRSQGDELPFFGFNPDLVMSPESAPPKATTSCMSGIIGGGGRTSRRSCCPAFENIRDQIGEIGFPRPVVGRRPRLGGRGRARAGLLGRNRIFRRLRIRVEPPVLYTEVIRTMSKGRSISSRSGRSCAHFKHLTLRYFEEFCADTIPLLDARGRFGRGGVWTGRSRTDLARAGGRKDTRRLAAARSLPGFVEEVRRHLLAHHSYHRRVEELVAALNH